MHQEALVQHIINNNLTECYCCYSFNNHLPDICKFATFHCCLSSRSIWQIFWKYLMFLHMHHVIFFSGLHCNSLSHRWSAEFWEVWMFSLWPIIKQRVFKAYPVSSPPYMIFVLFSPQTQFLAQFFSTQKCVNCNKKSQPNSINCPKKERIL